MKNIFLFLSVFLASCTSTKTFEEAMSLLNATKEKQEARTKEYIESEGKAINNLFEVSTPCRRIGIEGKSNIIIQISITGSPVNSWSSNENFKSVCIKGAINGIAFPNPPYTPYYVRVVM